MHPDGKIVLACKLYTFYLYNCKISRTLPLQECSLCCIKMKHISEHCRRIWGKLSRKYRVVYFLDLLSPVLLFVEISSFYCRQFLRVLLLPHEICFNKLFLVCVRWCATFKSSVRFESYVIKHIFCFFKNPSEQVQTFSGRAITWDACQVQPVNFLGKPKILNIN